MVVSIGISISRTNPTLTESDQLSNGALSALPLVNYSNFLEDALTRAACDPDKATCRDLNAQRSSIFFVGL
jgi:hypothetical protein